MFYAHHLFFILHFIPHFDKVIPKACVVPRGVRTFLLASISARRKIRAFQKVGRRLNKLKINLFNKYVALY